MIRRTSLSFLSVVAVLALAGWQVMVVPAARAQQQAVPPVPVPVPVTATPQGPLDERIVRLEQRILDLQTVIATLQTFVRDGGGIPPQAGFPPAGDSGGVTPGGGPSELSLRMLALETQIKALTSQMEQISLRLDQGNSGGGALPRQGALPQQQQGQQFGTPLSADPSIQNQSAGAPVTQPGLDQQPGVPGFNTSTASPQLKNPFADPGPAPQAQAGLQPPPQPFPPAATPSVALPGAGRGARAVYEASYESFLRKDFQSAGSGFQSFVKSFPDDELVSNAYYWLGRTHYARRQYEPAAKAFLAGYKKDKKNSIAPESLLHLGMSLGSMGEKEAACSTLGAIAKQFPNAPETLKRDVADIRKRTGC